jgi:hypothetical protein
VVQVWASSPNNDTPLLGAIGTVIQQSAQGRRGVTRIIVVLTREDIDHQYGGPEAVSAAQRNSIAIYPITVGITAGGGASFDEFSYSGGTSRGSDDDMRTRANLQEAVVAINGGLGWLAKLTNGQRWDLNLVNAAVLWEKILQQLAKRIRNDYVAGYYPSSAGPVKVRKVQLSLKRGVSGQISPKELYVRR